MKLPKVIFAGTPDFARVSLAALVGSGIGPVAVLTQPDRPAGRGKHVTPGPVKQYAERLGIAVLQPTSLNDQNVITEIKALEPDLIVVVAYGLILPQQVLDIPVAGCVNVHASLLPRWRGAAPIQAAILAGDKESGVCLMQMTAGLDSGPVFACDTCAIGDDETAGELHDRLADAGGRLLTRDLGAIVAGEQTPCEQDEALATYAAKISNADAALDWGRPAVDLKRQIRAYNPVPGAFFMLDDERIKCWRADCVDAADLPPGTIAKAERDGIVIACSDGALSVTSLQRPGKRPVTAAEFAAQLELTGRQL